MNFEFLDEKCPSFSSILANISKGDYWIDNINDPSLAIAYSYCVGGYAILGKPNLDKNVLENLVKKRIFPEIKNNLFEFSTENKEIETKILSIFSNKDIKSELEFSFRTANTINDTFYLSSSYQIVEVTPKFLLNINKYRNYSLLIERLDNSWHSYDDFFNYSLAYIAINNDEIVGVCFGSSLYKNYITIDIETNIDHRRVGLAFNMAKEFINKALLKNYIIHWDCVDSNIASKALAKKLGFELFKIRPYYWFLIH